ncbi:hypothetical protein ABZP36_005197 [Zizania latifolia]
MATRRRGAAPQPPAWTPEPWSDGETSALLDAWGPRYIRAAGGALRTVDWRACAAAVTAHRATAGRAPRTVEQCKNRMDYLKKRLRAERSRSRGPPPAPPVSGSLDRLRSLLRLAPSVPPGFTRSAIPKVEEEENTCSAPLPRAWPSVPKRPRTAVSLSPVCSSAGPRHEDGGTPCTEMVASLNRLPGTYERVEAAKQKEATRLEERCLEAMRDLEIERMRILVDAATATAAAASS